jgi:hypothetical protein
MKVLNFKMSKGENSLEFDFYGSQDELDYFLFKFQQKIRNLT